MDSRHKPQPLKYLQEKIREFIRERDWLKYHSPKNISMSIAIEAAELMEHSQYSLFPSDWVIIVSSLRIGGVF